MLNSELRILDFDGSFRMQENLLRQFKHRIIKLSDLGPRCRLWMNSATSDEIKARLNGSSASSVTFLGSGDFHHITPLLINKEEDTSLIVFDFHPDWDSLPPRRACGAWVTQALKSKNILKCILLGVSSDDISAPWIQSANLTLLKDQRLEIYPYAHRPTDIFFKKIPQNISIKIEKHFFKNRIYWNELQVGNLKEFLNAIIKRLPSRRVYLSIDKDCLKSQYALTNWEEGRLSLDELITMLKLIKEDCDIVGMDITGDYSKEGNLGLVKKIIYKIDHPKEIAADKFSQEEISRINEATNIKILEAVIS